jgi:hypothetical protein
MTIRAAHPAIRADAAARSKDRGDFGSWIRLDSFPGLSVRRG